MFLYRLRCREPPPGHGASLCGRGAVAAPLACEHGVHGVHEVVVPLAFAVRERPR